MANSVNRKQFYKAEMLVYMDIDEKAKANLQADKIEKEVVLMLQLIFKVDLAGSFLEGGGGVDFKGDLMQDMFLKW